MVRGQGEAAAHYVSVGFDGKPKIVLRRCARDASIRRELALVAALDPTLCPPQIGYSEADPKDERSAILDDLTGQALALRPERQ